jgi:membrane-bound lytic murein transglycosylase D
MSLGTVAPYAYDSVRVAASTPVSTVALAAGVPLDSVRDLNPHLLRGVSPPSESYWVRVPTGFATGFDSAYAALDDSLRIGLRPVKAKKGTTVAGMARTAGITATQLRWYNPRLRASTIPAGTTVLVPRKEVVQAAFDVPDPAVERYGTSANGVHVVRRGETLSHIARRYSTTVASLRSLNRLRRDVIYAGQTIIVRGRTARRG